jgi:hypothetical protein
MRGKDRNFGKIDGNFRADSPCVRGGFAFDAWQLRSEQPHLSLCPGTPTIGMSRQLPVNGAGMAVWQAGGQALMMSC